MNLKNFSLYEPKEGSVLLTPAYDMLGAAIVNPKDDEELALTLNGRKKKLHKTDFLASAQTMRIEAITVENLIAKYVKLLPKLHDCISASFLSEELKDNYHALLEERIGHLNV